MTSNSTRRRGDDLIFSFWLIFSKDGDVRLARRAPRLERDERCMSLSAKLPLALWSTPTLSATIDVAADAMPSIDLNVATAALQQALGIDVDLKVVEP